MPPAKLVAFVILRFQSEPFPDVHYQLQLLNPSDVPLLLARSFRAAHLAALDPDAAPGQIAMDQDPPEMTLWVRAFREGLWPIQWNPSLAVQLARIVSDDPGCRALRQFMGLL